jgi:hypothetical protein
MDRAARARSWQHVCNLVGRFLLALRGSMRRRYVFCAVLASMGLGLEPRLAWASDLVVAVDPPTASVSSVTPADQPTPAPPPKKRDSAAFAASLYVLTATAIDDFRLDRIAFVARPALEVYVSVGLGDVSLVLGGTTLAIEVYAYDERTSVNYPALLTMGLHHDRWLVELSGGASLFTEDSAGPFELTQNQGQIPSPRAELRAGGRFLEIVELRGVLSAEQRIAADSADREHSLGERDSVTRFFAGVAFGIGGS